MMRSLEKNDFIEFYWHWVRVQKDVLKRTLHIKLILL